MDHEKVIVIDFGRAVFCVLFWSDRLCRGESCSAME